MTNSNSHFLNMAPEQGVPASWIGAQILTQPEKGRDGVVSFQVRHKYSTRQIICRAQYETELKHLRSFQPDQYVVADGYELDGVLVLKSMTPYK